MGMHCDQVIHLRLEQGNVQSQFAAPVVDDSLSVLESARDYGIGYLIRVLKPDTRGPARESEGFMAIEDFSAILPK